jgi:O-methyltransferase
MWQPQAIANAAKVRDVKQRIWQKRFFYFQFNVRKGGRKAMLAMIKILKKILKPIVRAVLNKRKSVLYLKMGYPTYSQQAETAAVNADYIRHTTIALAGQRILSDKIEGAFAEAGVYKGRTSKFIHDLAKDRKLFLFDTFEGFPTQDLEVSEDNRFKDTSVEAVLNHIGDTHNIVIKQGYVPDTLADLENERFAFVLLDLDLYAPTLASLEFFYPRLAAGGYLMVHDYNNVESNWACRKAVDGFLQNKRESIVEIPDVCGSILFRKCKS